MRELKIRSEKIFVSLGNQIKTIKNSEKNQSYLEDLYLQKQI